LRRAFFRLVFLERQFPAVLGLLSHKKRSYAAEVSLLARPRAHAPGQQRAHRKVGFCLARFALPIQAAEPFYV